MAPAAQEPGAGGSGEDRRSNALLRLLIDEMLEQLRELQQHAGPWPAAERADAEAALARIMGRVREEALHRPLPPAA